MSRLAATEVEPVQMSLDLSEAPAMPEACDASSAPVAEQPAKTPATLAEVLARLEEQPVQDRRRVEMKSALRRLADIPRRPLTDISANPAELRRLIGAATPAALGLTKERWSRIRSLVLASLREVGCDVEPGRDVCGRSQAWQALAAQLSDKTVRVGLSRFMSHCTRRGVEPGDVTQSTFDGFHEALTQRSLHQKPLAVHRATLGYWKRAQKCVPSWPQSDVALERHPRFYSEEWTDFPATFQADVEAYLAQSGSDDVFDEDYFKVPRPSTIALRRRQLRQLASLLVSSGLPADQIVNLGVLVEPRNAKAALQQQRIRTDGKIGVSLGQQTWLLAIIARHWVKAPDHAAQLATIAKRLSNKPKGMTQRNRERLRQFDLPANRAALLDLPERVFDRAKRQALGTPHEARGIMLALAVEIATMVPLRANNLCKLELDRHLVSIGNGRRRVLHLLIPAAEMKTGEAFEVILPERTAALIDLYVRRYRSRIWSAPSPYLFVSSRGRSRETTSFSQAISKFILNETGLIMHLHLFRQLAGKLHLDENPSDLETVRRLLGHSTSATTSRYYAENKSQQAFKLYDGTIDKLRKKSARPKAPRRPRKPGKPGKS